MLFWGKWQGSDEQSRAYNGLGSSCIPPKLQHPHLHTVDVQRQWEPGPHRAAPSCSATPAGPSRTLPVAWSLCSFSWKLYFSLQEARREFPLILDAQRDVVCGFPCGSPLRSCPSTAVAFCWCTRGAAWPWAQAEVRQHRQDSEPFSPFPGLHLPSEMKCSVCPRKYR